MLRSCEEFYQRDGKGHFSVGQQDKHQPAAVEAEKVWLAAIWLTTMMKRSVVFVPDAEGVC